MRFFSSKPQPPAEDDDRAVIGDIMVQFNLGDMHLWAAAPVAAAFEIIGDTIEAMRITASADEVIDVLCGALEELAGDLRTDEEFHAYIHQVKERYR